MKETLTGSDDTQAAASANDRVVLVLDRSIPIGRENMTEVIGWRRDVAQWLRDRLGQTLDAIVVFAETARVAEKKAVEDGTMDLRYGSNLEHALEVAGELCREVNAKRIVVVAYSAPSAHRVESGEVAFAYPPLTDSFVAAEVSAERCRRAGLVIDAIVLDEPLDQPDELANGLVGDLPAIFRAITQLPVIAAPLRGSIDAIRRLAPTQGYYS